MKIQVDLSKEINKALELHKIKHDLYDKRTALIDVLQRYFKKELKKE